MGRPTLSSQFFTDHPVNRSFIDKWKSAYVWTESVLPVYEWEGLLYVAVEPSESGPSNPKWIVVEADSADLQKVWKDFQGVAEADGPDGLLPEQDYPAIKDPTVKPKKPSTPPVTNIAEVATKKAPTAKDVENIFTQLLPFYEKIMILLKNNDEVIPWRWHGFEQKSLKDRTINLTSPSPFRIVNRTELPFHGHPAVSETLDQFVSDWNDTLYPENLTICPVMVNQELLGMLVCFGQKTSNTKSTLNFAVTKSSDVSEILKALPPKVA